jgi:hypothetical protein
MLLIKSSKERLGGGTRKPDGAGVAEGGKENVRRLAASGVLNVLESVRRVPAPPGHSSY